MYKRNVVDGRFLSMYLRNFLRKPLASFPTSNTQILGIKDNQVTKISYFFCVISVGYTYLNPRYEVILTMNTVSFSLVGTCKFHMVQRIKLYQRHKNYRNVA